MTLTIKKLKRDIENGNASMIAISIQRIEGIIESLAPRGATYTQLSELLVLANDRMLKEAYADDVAQQLYDLKKLMGQWMKVILAADYKSEQFAHAKQKYNELKAAYQLIDRYTL